MKTHPKATEKVIVKVVALGFKHSKSDSRFVFSRGTFGILKFPLEYACVDLDSVQDNLGFWREWPYIVLLKHIPGSQ